MRIRFVGLLIVTIVFFAAPASRAQLYTTGNFHGGLGVFRVSLTTGAPTPVATISGQGSVRATAADSQTRRLFVLFENSLATVDADTGSVQIVSLGPLGFHTVNTSAEFDPSSGRVIAATTPAGTTTVYAIDPATGSFSTIATFSGGSSYDMALDPVSSRVFFITGSEMRVVDLTTGGTSTVPVDQSVAGFLLAFDTQTSRIISVQQGIGTGSIVAIDPDTGHVESLTPITSAQLVLSGFAFSSALRRTAFVTFTSPDPSSVRMVIANVATDEVAYLPFAGSLFQFLDPATVDPTEIPTLGASGLALLGVALAGLAAYALRHA